jgi:predicted naringenin-chalcone synthase
MTTAYLNRIATAVPEHDVHDAFVVFAEQMLADPRLRTVFRRMVSRAGIAHRYSSLDPQKDLGQFWSHDAHEFYRLGNFPNTARRMELFEQNAPVLMRKAVDRLMLNEKERSGITHVLVTCCTGLYAPGLDFEIVDHLGLHAGVERTMVGFMGAAHCALRPEGWCAYGQPGAVHAALPGDAGAGAGALVPGLCRWRGGEPDYRVRAGLCSGQL